MSATADILRRAKRLSRTELSRLVKQLEAHLSATTNGTQSGTKATTNYALRRQRGGRRLENANKRTNVSYARSLALAGTAHSDYTDVSSHKGKHLAEVYAPRR